MSSFVAASKSERIVLFRRMQQRPRGVLCRVACDNDAARPPEQSKATHQDAGNLQQVSDELGIPDEHQLAKVHLRFRQIKKKGRFRRRAEP